MRPRHALTGAVSVVGAGALAWCAWLLLRADLTSGTTLAAVALWLLAAAAVVTLVAFVREAERHRKTVGPGAASSWKPLPGLVLLWVGGLTALLVFPFMLSGASDRAGASAEDETTSPAGMTSGSVSPTRATAGSASRSATRSTGHASTAGPDPVATSPSSRPPTPRTTTASEPATTPAATSAATSATPRTSQATRTRTTNPAGITVTLPLKPTRPSG